RHSAKIPAVGAAHLVAVGGLPVGGARGGVVVGVAVGERALFGGAVEIELDQAPAFTVVAKSALVEVDSPGLPARAHLRRVELEMSLPGMLAGGMKFAQLLPGLGGQLDQGPARLRKDEVQDGDNVVAERVEVAVGHETSARVRRGMKLVHAADLHI